MADERKMRGAAWFWASLATILTLFMLRPAFALTRLVEVLATGVTNNSGVPLSYGTVTFYDAGTLTLRTVYSDFALGSAVANPASLDAAGRIVVYSNKRLKLVIKSHAGATVRTIDNVGTAGSDLAVDISASTLDGDGLTAPGDGSLAVNVDNSTLDISADVLRVKPTANLSVASVTTTGNSSAGGDLSVTGATSVSTLTSSGNATIGGTGKIGGASGATLTYATTSPSINRLQHSGPVQVGGTTGPILATFGDGRTLKIGDATSGTYRPTVVSVAPSSYGLMIVRGEVNSGGTILVGEGFTVTHTGGTSNYTMTFSTAFADKPVCTYTGLDDGYIATTDTGNGGNATTVGRVIIMDAGGVYREAGFTFICIGQRGS